MNRNLDRLVWIAMLVCGFSVAAIAVVFSPFEMPWGFGVHSLVEKIEQEEREFAGQANAERAELAAQLDAFTGGEPVEIVELQDGGAIVANRHGATLFARPDGVDVAVGERRWLALGTEAFMIGERADSGMDGHAEELDATRFVGGEGQQ